MAILTFTDAAILHIQNILTKHPSESMFRLSIKETGCSGYMYVPEIVQVQKPDDIVLDFSRLPVLIDASSVSLIEGTLVDYIKKEFGQSQLSFNNPNAEGLCGCGESFKLKK